jgi:Flp pilus assembly protein TadG
MHLHQRESTGRVRGWSLRAADRVCAGDGDGPIQFAVSLSGDTEVAHVDEHGDDEGVAMRLAAMGGRRNSRQRGATLVEQALILPVLLAIFFGVIDMSRALYTYSFVSYIARDAARYASARTTDMNGARAAVSPTEVSTYVKNVSGQGLDPTLITANTTYVPPTNGSPLCTTVKNKPGCIVQVTVNYNFAFITPFIPTRTLTMSSESQMIITQ